MRDDDDVKNIAKTLIQYILSKYNTRQTQCGY